MIADSERQDPGCSEDWEMGVFGKVLVILRGVDWCIKRKNIVV